MLSIIVRTKNEEASIGGLLDALVDQCSDVPSEIIIVDSGSIDNTLGIAKRYGVRLAAIPESRFTYGHSLNCGIQKASGDIICCLSAHCIPSGREWLSELVKPILEGSAHATYGRQIPVSGLNPFEELFLSRRFPEDMHPSERVPFSNANCAFLKKMWDEVKFDESISSWEDYLWYLLTMDRFIFRYVPNACVVHSHPFSVSRTGKTAYMDGKAFRYIKDIYGFDILEHISSPVGKLKYAINDISRHALFFLEKGYAGYLLALPFVKLYSYLNYWRGYHNSSAVIRCGGTEHSVSKYK